MNEKILIVDDDLDMLDHLGSSLVSKKFKVSIAYNADIALEMLMKERIDLLITDIEMPDKDGFYLADHVRRIIKYRKLPIIMLSEHKDREIVNKASKINLTTLMVKPVELPELHSTIAQFFSKGRGTKSQTRKIVERKVLNKLSILVVDDEESIRTMLLQFLNILVKYVGTASSAGEAKTLLQNHDIDIVITDIQMPDKSGFELAKWIDEYPQTAGMPVIMMTGVKRDVSSVKLAKQLWIDRYLVKPFDLQSLKGILFELGSKQFQRQKLTEFKKYLIKQEMADAEEENFILSGQRKKIFNLKKDLNKVTRKIQRLSQESHSMELAELNVSKAKLESKVNILQDEIGKTKKLFFERRKSFATLKRFNVQRVDKLKD